MAAPSPTHLAHPARGDMPVSSDGTKLLARGATVILADGVPRKLILDMEALVVIEERVGSLSAYSEGLQRGFRGKVIKSVLAGLIGGLAHLEAPSALSPRQISHLMKYQDVQVYIDALDAAWAENVPTIKNNGQTSGKGSGVASSSRGRKSTGGSRSSTAAVTATSGA